MYFSPSFFEPGRNVSATCVIADVLFQLGDVSLIVRQIEFDHFPNACAQLHAEGYQQGEEKLQVFYVL